LSDPFKVFLACLEQSVVRCDQKGFFLLIDLFLRAGESVKIDGYKTKMEECQFPKIKEGAQHFHKHYKKGLNNRFFLS